MSMARALGRRWRVRPGPLAHEGARLRACSSPVSRHSGSVLLEPRLIGAGAPRRGPGWFPRTVI